MRKSTNEVSKFTGIQLITWARTWDDANRPAYTMEVISPEKAEIIRKVHIIRVEPPVHGYVTMTIDGGHISFEEKEGILIVTHDGYSRTAVVKES